MIKHLVICFALFFLSKEALFIYMIGLLGSFIEDLNPPVI
jgi:hypothetical protein